MNDWFADGATADYCINSSSSVAVKPSRLSHLEAASVPIGALTAWQGLFERAKLQAGEFSSTADLGL
jgi:NADPH:quinone reductase-like Zn-dependent oxidoreductase